MKSTICNALICTRLKYLYTSSPGNVSAGYSNQFLEYLEAIAEKKKIISIDKVRDEIYENEDVLKVWVEANLSEDFFKSTNNQEVLNEYRLMAPWAESKSDHYQRAAINEFLDYKVADEWLVSYCRATGNTIVTQEVSNPQRKNKIQLPEPCNHFGVNYCDMITMFRSLGVQF